MTVFRRMTENLDKYALAQKVPVVTEGKKIVADRVVKTVCPHNCYDTCGILAYVKDEKVIKLEGDPDHPITRGHLCVKGYANIQKINNPDRIKYPLIRVGDRGEGKFRQGTWDEALDLIVKKFINIRSRYGGEALIEYAYSGNREHMAKTVSGRFLNLFGASKLVGSFCLLSGAAGSYYTVGDQHTMMPDIWSDKTDLIFLVGRNPSATNPHIFPFLYRAMERGAKLIVVDPYLTPLASKADLYLQPRPGSDLALVLGMMNHIIKNNLYNQDFVSKYTFGFEELWEEVKKMPVEQAARLTGIESSKIIQAAEWYSGNNTQTECGYGHQRYSNGHQVQRAYACLAAICGHIGKETGNYNYIDQMGFPTLSGFLKADKVAVPGENVPKTRLINISKFATALLASEKTDIPIKAVFSYRGGLISQQPDVSTTVTALKNLELFVCVEQFRTDDTDWADIVLPACHFLEQYSLHPSYWHHYLQIGVPVCQPANEAVPDYEIWAELGRRMGWEEYFPREQTGLDYISALVGEHLEIEQATSPQGPLRLPEEWCPRVPYQDLKFNTLSGKIELYSQGMVERGTRFPGDFRPVPYLLEPEESLYSTPKLAEEFPFMLISQHPSYRMHSQFYNIPWIKEIEGPPKVFINIGDAERLAIKEGDKVRIYNKRGEISNILAKPSIKVKSGNAELSSGMWVKSGANVNILTSRSVGGPREVLDGIMAEYHPLLDGNTTAYFNTLVQIEKI